MSVAKITKFDDEYDFLSNFYISLIHHNGIRYTTVEHFFQARKAINEEDFFNILNAPSPGSAKRLGRKATIREDWDEVKDSIMFIGLLLKFTQHPDLRDKLKKTGSAYLEEGNNWGDKYWGTVDGEGKNMLGKLLMIVRGILTFEYFEMVSKTLEDYLKEI